MFLEVAGRVSLGDGVLKVIIPDLESVFAPKKMTIEELPVIQRNMSESIFDEVKEKDRKALDVAILKSLGLDPDKYLSRIYDGLCEMVSERLELPKMRKKQQKETVKIAVDQIRQSVIEEYLADGPKKFPEQFYDHPLTEREVEGIAHQVCRCTMNTSLANTK